MKNYMFALLFAFVMPAKAQLADTFSDGEFAANPQWSGTSGSFTVNSSLQLQTAGNGSGSAWLSVPCFLPNFKGVHWQTSVRQSFAPSASNFGRVYLTSDNADLTKPLHGYFIQFGEAGSSDALELFRQDGTATVPVCRGKTGGIAASFSVRVDVLCENGVWKISTDYNGGNDFLRDATGIDSTYTSSIFFGLYCTYTASNASKFYYDDFFVGIPHQDPLPDTALVKDIVVSEIFADPDPEVGLPATEYIELLNRGDKNIKLNGWKLSDGSTDATLPDAVLLSGEYAVITAASSAGFFSAAHKVIGAEKFPSLNNDSDDVILKNADNKTIDSVHYDMTWYRDSDKQDGGWSLELIDPDNPCGEGDNWTASENPHGGTPGFQNSVFARKPDVTGPRLVGCVPLSASQIILRFDEKLAVSPVAADAVVLDPPKHIRKIFFHDISLRELVVDLAEDLDQGVLYTIVVSRLTDCNGNRIQEAADHVTFALPDRADSLDIVINEVLFNPRPLGVDFAEVRNVSDKYISLKNARLASFTEGRVENSVVITANDFLLAPNSFVCFTSDTAALKTNYPNGQSGNFFLSRLPPLPDDEGSLAMISAEGVVLDMFLYSKNFHSMLVQDDEGVSLERISISGSTTDPQNWTSASGQCGFATPGYLNSASREGPRPAVETVVVDPVIFIPGSGTPDFAKINYRFDHGGYSANVKIIDPQARLIRTLANNVTVGTEGFFRWDGDRDDGTRARMGYYVVWVEVFDISGVAKTFRKRIVVSAP